MTVWPARVRLVQHSIVTAIWLIAVASIIATGVAAALRWRTANVALAFRAGHPAGVAWATPCSFGAWLPDGVKKMVE